MNLGCQEYRGSWHSGCLRFGVEDIKECLEVWRGGFVYYLYQHTNVALALF